LEGVGLAGEERIAEGWIGKEGTGWIGKERRGPQGNGSAWLERRGLESTAQDEDGMGMEWLETIAQDGRALERCWRGWTIFSHTQETT